MGVTFSTYYSLVKLREQGPEARDWAVTDNNIDVLTALLKSSEQHSHTGAAGLLAPTTPPVLTEQSTGGVLAPGVTVGVRISYVNSLGLETDATVEQDITLSVASDRPLTPTLDAADISPLSTGLSGGIYMYVMTKVKGSGETDASDALPVTIPYDQSYEVPLDFDNISSYTDGTTQLNIYRSAGLNSSFQLIAEITDTTAATYVDDGASVDQTTQPPAVSTFDSTKSVSIDWSTLGTYPVGAVTLRVYVTQQSGIWSSAHLLTTIDLTAITPPTSYVYQGSETLDTGWPKDLTQTPNAPQKVNLATEATGGFVLTADGDFQQHQAKNLVIESKSSAPSSPLAGQVYYDTSINDVRAYINGTWTNWGITAGSAYTHPAEEIGGHDATHVIWQPGNVSGPTVGSLLSSFFDAAGLFKQSTETFVQSNNAASTTTSTTPTAIPGLSAIIIQPAAMYTSGGSQLVLFIANGSIVLSGTTGGFGALAIQVTHSGVPVGNSATVVNSLITGTFGVIYNYTAVALVAVNTNYRVSVNWWVTTGSQLSFTGANQLNLYAISLL